MSDRNSGGHHSRTLTLRRLGWFGAVLLLGAALLIPATSVAAQSTPQCGCSHTSTTSTTSTDTTTTETSDVSQTSETTATTETSDVSETTETTKTSETTETTETTATTETSDVSETTVSTQTTTIGTGTGGGGVRGETGTPDVTPPSTSTLDGSSGSSDGWRIILLALAGIAVLSLILLPGDRKSKQR
jgi:cytoskeletal protein RodZ